MKRALMALALFAIASPALAQKFSLGSASVQACSKTLVLTISAPNFPRVQGELRQCAEQGVATATLRALVRNAPGSAAAFWTEFQVCTRYIEWDSADLSVEGSCR